VRMGVLAISCRFAAIHRSNPGFCRCQKWRRK
jgi:hypothetical protein